MGYGGGEAGCERIGGEGMGLEEKMLASDGSNEPTYAITDDGQIIGVKTKRINGMERNWKLDDIIRLLDDGMRFRQMRKGE